MEYGSVFSIFKIGVGPSSSHTLGPWIAAKKFVSLLKEIDYTSIEVCLYGSLSKTGKGHCTDIALALGLQGYNPQTIDTEKIAEIIQKNKTDNYIYVDAKKVPFIWSENILFKNRKHEGHPNTMIFIAKNGQKQVLKETFFSIGGGFIEHQGAHISKTKTQKNKIPFRIKKAADLLKYIDSTHTNISDIVLENERSQYSDDVIKSQLRLIYEIMIDCVYSGCNKEGVLPGGLNVKRRAKQINDSLLSQKEKNKEQWLEAIKKTSNKNFDTVNKWISCFSLAINEENANLGRVVTAPTNGAAGVIPAVLLYYLLFCDNSNEKGYESFLLTAAQIGFLFKQGATISAALGGCQAEIGVSSAMAAAGLTEVLGGSPNQALMAAEIAMEHHLGMTCDPIGGLVQIPCIERNAMGAMKAITASTLALTGDPLYAKVDLDSIIKTMWKTAQDMNVKYKETAMGGLAINVPINVSEC